MARLFRLIPVYATLIVVLFCPLHCTLGGVPRRGEDRASHCCCCQHGQRESHREVPAEPPAGRSCFCEGALTTPSMRADVDQEGDPSPTLVAPETATGLVLETVSGADRASAGSLGAPIGGPGGSALRVALRSLQI